MFPVTAQHQARATSNRESAWSQGTEATLIGPSSIWVGRGGLCWSSRRWSPSLTVAKTAPTHVRVRAGRPGGPCLLVTQLCNRKGARGYAWGSDHLEGQRLRCMGAASADICTGCMLEPAQTSVSNWPATVCTLSGAEGSNLLSKGIRAGRRKNTHFKGT